MINIELITPIIIAVVPILVQYLLDRVLVSRKYSTLIKSDISKYIENASMILFFWLFIGINKLIAWSYKITIINTITFDLLIVFVVFILYVIRLFKIYNNARINNASYLNEKDIFKRKTGIFKEYFVVSLLQMILGVSPAFPTKPPLEDMII